MGSAHPRVFVTLNLLLAGLLLVVLIRFGLLCLVVALCVWEALNAPLTTDFSTWYSGITVFTVGIVLLLAGYGFYAALAGRPLFREGFLEN